MRILLFTEQLIITITYTGPNLKLLCIQHSDASCFSKSHEKNIWPKKLKTHLNRGTQLTFYPSEALMSPFFKFGALFIPATINIILYSFFLVWTTFISWQIIMYKFFIVSGYQMISHWKIKILLKNKSNVSFNRSVLNIFIKFTVKHTE